MDQHFPPEDKGSVSSPTPSASNGNFDTVLFRNLVEMVPLVESLMDRRSNTSFTRRASVIYTKPPVKDLNSRKAPDTKGRRPVPAVSTRKERQSAHNTIEKYTSRENQDSSADDFSTFARNSSTSEKEREELLMLHEQVKELHKKLAEKDEILKSAEESINHFNLVQMEVENLKQQMEEKDSLIRSTRLELSDAKIKLAGKQAAMEKLEWEVHKSSKEADEVRNELDHLQNEITMFMRIFETSKRVIFNSNFEDCAIAKEHTSRCQDMFQSTDITDNEELHKLEIVRKEYLAAIAVAKEKADEHSLSIISQSRLNLLSLLSGVHEIEMKQKHAQWRKLLAF